MNDIGVFVNLLFLTIIKNCNDQNHKRGEVEFPNQSNEHKAKLQHKKKQEIVNIWSFKQLNRILSALVQKNLPQYEW